jgi:hypothetical protein
VFEFGLLLDLLLALALAWQAESVGELLLFLSLLPSPLPSFSVSDDFLGQREE